MATVSGAATSAAAIKKRIVIPLKSSGPSRRPLHGGAFRRGTSQLGRWNGRQIYFAVLHRLESIPPIIVRRPDKTELEFAIVAACMALPAGYWLVRTLFSLIAG